MPGIGTIVNMLGIIIGGLIGLLGRRFIQERLQDSLMKATGLCVIFIGIGGALEKMLVISDGSLTTTGTMILIGSFTIGTLIGEGFNIEKQIERFGEWLKRKTGNSDDASFVGAFVTASFTVCIGAMAIVGSIQDGIEHNISTLLMKAILDLLIIMVMTASLGKGCIFSAIPVGILQGSVTILATLIAPYLTDTALGYLSMTGSILIFCVGVNLVFGKIFKVANMLPVIFIAAIAGMVGL